MRMIAPFIAEGTSAGGEGDLPSRAAPRLRRMRGGPPPATDLPSRADFPVLRPQPTRWHDNDHYGHVNNVVYHAWFDTAVNGWLMDATGVDIRDLPARGYVVETSCAYLRPVSFPDHLWVGLALDRLGDRSVAYRLAVFRGDEEEPVAVGRFVHVYVDPATGRSTAVPEEIRTVVQWLRDRSAERG